MTNADNVSPGVRTLSASVRIFSDTRNGGSVRDLYSVIWISRCIAVAIQNISEAWRSATSKGSHSLPRWTSKMPQFARLGCEGLARRTGTDARWQAVKRAAELAHLPADALNINRPFYAKQRLNCPKLRDIFRTQQVESHLISVTCNRSTTCLRTRGSGVRISPGAPISTRGCHRPV